MGESDNQLTSIHCWLTLQGMSGCFDKGRHESQFDTMLLDKCIFVLFPHLRDMTGGKERTNKQKNGNKYDALFLNHMKSEKLLMTTLLVKDGNIINLLSCSMGEKR